MSKVVYQVWKPGHKPCVAWMPPNWFHNRRPGSKRRTRP